MVSEDRIHTVRIRAEIIYLYNIWLTPEILAVGVGNAAIYFGAIPKSLPRYGQNWF
jgi:hypothetical protein